VKADLSSKTRAVDCSAPFKSLRQVRIGSPTEVERMGRGAQQQPTTLDFVHVEFPGRATISVESVSGFDLRETSAVKYWPTISG
jgi:hypothetical protein